MLFFQDLMPTKRQKKILHIGLYSEWTDRLLAVLDWGINDIKDLHLGFKDANLLSSIPDTDFPHGCTNASGCFDNCYELQLTSGFTIKNSPLTNTTFMFQRLPQYIYSLSWQFLFTVNCYLYS